MRIKRTHYEVLGLPRTATPDEIKQQYRKLARENHPDVAPDKAAAEAEFVEISEAYQVLSNPDKRTIYDSELDAEMFRVEPRRGIDFTTPSDYGSAAPGRRRSAPSHSEQARRLVQEAETAFTQGDLRSAAWLCKQARQLDSRNVQAHVVLGDIYRVQGQTEQAISMYTIASQLNPLDSDVTAKLNRLLRQTGNNHPVPVRERRVALKVGLNLMGWSMSAFMFMMLMMSPGKPIPWLEQNLRLVGTWSTMLFAVLMVTGAITGFLLSVNGSVQLLDGELVFQAMRRFGPRRSSFPVGLVLLAFNMLSFYVAVGVYVIISIVQDSLSNSVLKSFATTFALVLVAAFVYAPGRAEVLTFGGNVAFPAVLFGWAIGDMFRPSW